MLALAPAFGARADLHRPELHALLGGAPVYGVGHGTPTETSVTGRRVGDAWECTVLGEL